VYLSLFATLWRSVPYPWLIDESMANAETTERQRIDEREYIVAPVLRREPSVRDWRQSFNGAAEFTRFRRNDPIT
jgi:hypothetical protein